MYEPHEIEEMKDRIAEIWDFDGEFIPGISIE